MNSGGLHPAVGVLATRGRAAVLMLVVALIPIVGVGCASNEYIRLRPAPTNPLAGPLQLVSRKGPQASPRTKQLLRRYDLATERPAETLARLREEIDRDPLPEKLYACAELSYVHGKRAEAMRNQARALDLYATSVAYAYWYLFDPRFDRFRNPYDPQFRGACDVYNGALEAAMRMGRRQGRLRPGSTWQLSAGSKEFRVQIVPRGRWRVEDFESLDFVSNYEIKGLANRHHTYGLGVPLIAVRRGHVDDGVASEFYPPGLSFAVTAFLRMAEPMAACRPFGDGIQPCVLELHDTATYKDIEVCARQVPLETDLTTPLAFFLDNPAFRDRKNIANWTLLKPDSAERLRGIYMFEPYDPNKIPVLMVHGLWSGPVTWMEMFNDLRSFPEIRDQYQFWFYLYPWGQPFWVSSKQLREDLDHARQVLDPQRRCPALDQMVLVGHSMGGIIARLQTVESGTDFWEIVSDRPFDELQADAETREQLARTVFFHPNPSIRQVITIGTPHRGSNFANDYTRWLGRKLIQLPELMVRTTQQINLNNPGFFRNTGLLTTTTSIDSLSPDSPALPVVLRAQKSPRTSYHNIIGVVPDEGIVGSLATGSDGVVTFESAHLEDADSEIVVEADHIDVHRHPRSILEVRRILLDHRLAAFPEMMGPAAVSPVSYP